MADSVNPSFLGGLMAALSGGLQKQQTEPGMAGLGTNPIYNAGLGLMAAAAPRFGAPSGNIGEALMGAQQATVQNRQAAQQLAMGKIQLDMANMKLPVQQAMLNNEAGQTGGGQPPPPFLASPQNQTSPPPALGLDSLMAQGAPAPQGQGPLMGPQSAAPRDAPLPPWLTPPTQAGIDATPVYGTDPRLLRAYSMMNGKDPIETNKVIQAEQLAAQQRKYAPYISKLEDVVKGDVPTRMVRAEPDMFAAWNQVAPKYGYDPVRDFTDANVRQVAGHLANQLRAPLGQASETAPVALQHVQNGAQNVEINPIDGSRKYNTDPNQLTLDQAQNLKIAQGKLDLERQNQTDKFIVPGVGIREMPKAEGIKKGLEPYTPYGVGKELFGGQVGELGAALAERGVSLPAGMRSKEQQASLFQGLIARHTDMNVDQIADLVKSGKLSLAGDMKEQTTAGGIVGKVKYAENELTQSIPLALDASKNVPRGNFMPLNKLMQMADTSISDPALRDLKIKTQSVMNAYDMLAARSGTDVGKRESAHRLLSSADSPEAYNAALKAFAQEAQVAHRAGDLSMGRTPTPTGKSSPQTVHWDDLK